MWLFSKLRPSAKPDSLRFELELLAHFRIPRDPEAVASDPRWEEVFGESPLKVVARLHDRGQLVAGSLEDHLSAGFTAKELKDLCRTNGLKVSGTRDVLVTRLAESIPDTAKALFTGKTLLRCSAEAQQVADRLMAEKEAKRTAAETGTRTALRARDLERACRTVADFEAGQLFSRGLGIDWARYDSRSDLARLSILFERWPRLVDFVPAKERDEFRVAAGEVFLWGVSRPLRSSVVPDVEGPLSPAVVVQSLVCFVQMEAKFHELKSSRAKAITLIRDDSCEGCQKGPDVFHVQAPPEIPRPECTNPNGCRCYFSAEWE